MLDDLLAERLAAVRAIEDEESRAQMLSALAPHLTGDLREQALVEGLAAVRAIEDERDRTEALATLLPYLDSSDVQSVRKECQAIVLAALREVENAKREEVFGIWADEDAFDSNALGFTPAPIAHIAEAVIDVCRRWDWV